MSKLEAETLLSAWGKSCLRTRVDLPVAGHPVGVDDVLEAGRERVDGEQSGRGRGGGQPVVEGVHAAAALPLEWEEEETGVRKEGCALFHTHLDVSAMSHPSLPQGALQLRQLGRGAPGLGDQALVCDGRAAQVQHHLHGLALLHPHLPLGQHGHRLRQQLLQEVLGLRQHLSQTRGRNRQVR